METRLTVHDYLALPETNRPMELVYGRVHEPPAPNYGHQSVVTRLTAQLDAHVRRHRLGRVCVSPVDVVLDRDAALVVQPDVIFVSTERLNILGDRVWGAPDLTVEVLSAGTAARDRTLKVGWYRQYGVRECWLIEPAARAVEVFTFDPPSGTRPERFEEDSLVRSRVLPQLELRAGTLFEL